MAVAVHNKTSFWLEENEKFFLPPVCNKMMHNDQLKVREAVKKNYGGFFLQGVHLTLDYDDMYSETDFTPEIQYMIY